MTAFQDICALYSSESFFNFLYVGDNLGHFEKLRSAVEAKGRIEASRQVRSSREAMDAGLGTASWDGCLLLAWEAPASGDFQAWADQLPNYIGSPQTVACIAVDGDIPIPFRHFRALIGKDVFAVGSTDLLADALGAICGEGDLGTLVPDLRLSIRKRPSRWIRCLKHDYVANTVLPQPSRSTFEKAGLWEVQREIDFLQSVLSNLLCFPWALTQGRLGLGSDEDCPWFISARETESGMIAPQSLLEALLSEYGNSEGISTYQTGQEAAALVAEAVQEGVAPILIRDAGLEMPLPMDAGTASRPVPTVLVSNDGPRLRWDEWCRRLNANMVGAHSISDFKVPAQGKSLPAQRRPYWRACAVRSLPGIFERLIELLDQTYDRLMEIKASPQLSRDVFDTLASVWFARGLYLDRKSTEIPKKEVV